MIQLIGMKIGGFRLLRPALQLEDVAELQVMIGDTRVQRGDVRWFGIGVGEKLAWWKKLTVRGTASHASVPLGDNPVDRLVSALHRVAQWRTPVRLTPAVARFFQAQAREERGEHRSHSRTSRTVGGNQADSTLRRNTEPSGAVRSQTYSGLVPLPGR